MKMYIEVQDHKVELITKLLEHISFVKIKRSQVPEDQFQQRSVGVVQPRNLHIVLPSIIVNRRDEPPLDLPNTTKRKQRWNQ